MTFIKKENITTQIFKFLNTKTFKKLTSELTINDQLNYH